MIDLEHLMLYDGKPWKFSDYKVSTVFNLQGVKYRKYGVPVLFNQSCDIGYADIEIAPLKQRDEIGVALYADIHVNSDKLPEKYTVGLDIHIDEGHYIHPGVELAINKDKWITTSTGSWLVTDATVDAIIITEGETLTWLINGRKNTTTQTQQMRETKEMEHTHTQTENYDLSQPICENPQLALEALKQIIQANKDGNNEAVIFMTVKRCQKCGEWPTCRLDSDGQHVTIAIECSQDSSHARYIPTMDDTVKDIIRMWNHINSNPFMEDRETRNKKSETEIAYTQQQIDSYSMAIPISQDVNCALAVLKQIIQENMQDSCIATLPIKRCPQCNALPTCRLDDKSTAIIMECVKDGHQHSYYCSRSNDSLTKIIIEWNKAQNIVRNSKSVKDKNVDNYDWDAPITDPWLAEDVFNDCIRKQSELEKAKMKIVRCARCGEYPVADVAVDTFVLGCPKCKRIFWARKCDSLTAVATDWNREQEIMETNKESLINIKPGEHEMATTGEMIEKYDWNELIANNRVLAADALEACIERNFPEQSQFDGAFMCGIPAKMEILRHRNSGEIPKVMKAEDGSNIGIGVEGLCYVWACPSETLTTLVNTWNKLQGKDGKRDDTFKTEATSTAIDSYDWAVPIENNLELAYNVLKDCLANNFAPFPTQNPKMRIALDKQTGMQPEAFISRERKLLGLGTVTSPTVWGGNMSLKSLVTQWNKIQDKSTKETTDEPPKETSLDVMGRNALALPQQAKTIDELEAEADKGLSKPEDVQKLKEANVLTGSQKAIAEVCDEIKELLLEKNRKYGNSALNPCRIFARSDRLEQIRVRIDDKLNRIKNEQWNEDEDVVKDLIGYLVLYTVAQLHDFNN